MIAKVKGQIIGLQEKKDKKGNSLFVKYVKQNTRTGAPVILKVFSSHNGVEIGQDVELEVRVMPRLYKDRAYLNIWELEDDYKHDTPF